MLIDELLDKQCKLTFHLVLGSKNVLESRPLRVLLFLNSLKTMLRPIVSPLEGIEAGFKGQVSGRPTRVTICCLKMVVNLTWLVLLYAFLKYSKSGQTHFFYSKHWIYCIVLLLLSISFLL